MPPGQFACGCCWWGVWQSQPDPPSQAGRSSAGCECKAASRLCEAPSGCSLYIPTLHLRDLNHQPRRLFFPWAFALHLSQQLTSLWHRRAQPVFGATSVLPDSAPHSERAMSEPSRARGEAGTGAGAGQCGRGFLRAPAPTPSSSAAPQGGEKLFRVHLEGIHSAQLEYSPYLNLAELIASTGCIPKS